MTSEDWNLPVKSHGKRQGKPTGKHGALYEGARFPVSRPVPPGRSNGKSGPNARARAEWPKWAAMRRAGMTLKAIGRAAGKDHSTIIYGLRKCEQNVSCENGGGHDEADTTRF